MIKIKRGVFWFCLIMILSNCQTEEHPIETHEHKILKKISLVDFKNKVSKKNFEEISKYFQSDTFTEVVSKNESSSEFIILTENIVATQKGHNTIFTFQLRKENLGQEFYNLNT